MAKSLSDQHERETDGWVHTEPPHTVRGVYDEDDIRILTHVGGKKYKLIVPNGEHAPTPFQMREDDVTALDVLLIYHPNYGEPFVEVEFGQADNMRLVADALKTLRSANIEFKKRLRKLAPLAAENAALKEQLAVLQQRQFGTSSEQNILATDPAANDPVKLAPTVPKPKRSSHGGGRKPLPADLPRDDVHHQLSKDERSCPCCNLDMQPAGAEISEQLTVIPAHYRVKRHIRAKYVCRTCRKFVIAKGEPSLLPGSSYGSSEVLAHVACQKFQFGLPFYRQEAIFRQSGLPFNRTTLANLMIAASEKLTPLIETMREHALGQTVLHGDETVVQVLKEDGRPAESNSYLWLFCSAATAMKPVVLFDYQETRSGDHAKQFLTMDDKQFLGYLQVDGYAGYNKAVGAKRVGCMAHVRRKFIDVLKLLPAGVTESPAQQACELIGQLYAIERQIGGLSREERKRIRWQQGVPILTQFKIWLDDMKTKVTPKGALGRAIGYALDQWEAVCRYVDDGDLAIDNNLAERQIKGVVIGRKNWLFSDSPDGMRANAVMYSLVHTAKANGIDPYQYLLYVFKTLPTLKTAAEVAQLLPWNTPLANSAELRRAA